MNYKKERAIDRSYQLRWAQALDFPSGVASCSDRKNVRGSGVATKFYFYKEI